MNYWKQLSHVLKYFAAEEGQATKLPQNFMSGFLEVCFEPTLSALETNGIFRAETELILHVLSVHTWRYPRDI
jgi:hypothetical protein